MKDAGRYGKPWLATGKFSGRRSSSPCARSVGWLIVAECGKYSCLGSRCAREAGHEGPHRTGYTNYRNTEWTDESDRRCGDAIAKSMEGRRD